MPDQGPVQPKLRRKYVSNACNECRRRKVRCNGRVPCYRCSRQHIHCSYTDTPTARTESLGKNADTTQLNADEMPAQLRSLQEQIATMAATIESFKAYLPPPNTAAAYATPPTQQVSQTSLSGVSLAGQGAFCGPTASAFTMDLAKTSLQRRGIVANQDPAEDGDETRPSSLAPISLSLRPDENRNNLSLGPLRRIGKIEALRLCHLYEEEMGIQYPILDLSELLLKLEALYMFLENQVPRHRPGQTGETPEGLENADIMIIRLVIACALTAEGNGQSELALSLFCCIQDAANSCIWGVPDRNSITILFLVATLYFQMDYERLAWRTIGIVARMCLDAGLHRHETFASSSPDRDARLRLLWCVYVLDIRWSFGTGMPFSIKETDIDPLLPKPDNRTPYLRVMVSYSRIAGQVWQYLQRFDNTKEIQKDRMEFLSWQVRQWAQDLPDSLRFDDSDKEHAREQRRSTRRLRALLYLRAQQLQVLIHRPVLHSAADITQYTLETDTVVTVAKDMIRFIARLNETSNIYQLQQVAFNWFLISALASLFLAVAHAPFRFNSQCEDEFYLALELVKGFSTRSYISRRLWKSIRSLKKLAPKLGLQSQDDEHIPSGHERQQLPLATGAVDDLISYTPFNIDQDLSSFNGVETTRELMGWFEAMSSFDGQGGTDFDTASLGQTESSTDALPFLDNGELYNLMRDCF